MKKLFKIIFCLFLLFISVIYIKDYLKNIKLDKDFNDINSNKILELFITKPMYKNSNVLSINNIKEEKIKEVKLDKTSTNNNYLFYIYNTHQTENYEENTKNPYNIKVDVKVASHILEDELKKLGFNSLVEERDVLNIVKNNNWSYPATYTVTKSFVEEIKGKYPSIKYFIDIHRDGAPLTATKASIDNKDYAKIMFTIGKDRDNLDNNLKQIEKIESYLNTNYPGILRNRFYRENDSFNQQLDDNMFLIEVGGQYNTLNEVYNTIYALAQAFNFLEG